MTPAADPLRRSRTSALWIGVIVFAVVLVLLLVFVLQNTQPVRISYLGATGDIPLAVAMLLATAAGILLTAVAGSLRIRQLRRRVPGRRKH
ncbi:LapA family protein [Actinokineospora terrae]|nr:LapA family protein [Actinokineospora terrae]